MPGAVLSILTPYIIFFLGLLCELDVEGLGQDFHAKSLF